MWYLLKEQVQSSMEGKNVKLHYGKEASSHGTSPAFEEKEAEGIIRQEIIQLFSCTRHSNRDFHLIKSSKQPLT